MAIPQLHPCDYTFITCQSNQWTTDIDNMQNLGLYLLGSVNKQYDQRIIKHANDDREKLKTSFSSAFHIRQWEKANPRNNEMGLYYFLF